MVTAKYRIEYKEGCGNGPAPPEIQVTIPTQGSAMQVMEVATDTNSTYGFTVSYITNLQGYTPDIINNTANNSPQ